MNVTCHFDFSSIVVEHEQAVTMMLRVKAPPAPAFTKRKPLNLSLVLDCSSSMEGAKIEYVREAATGLVCQLTPTDRLSVVTFNYRVTTIVPPQRVADRAPIQAAISEIHAGGKTNLSGGWLEGLGHVKLACNPVALNRVLLLTDGLANEGVRDPAGLTSIGRTYLEKGISTTTLGFGEDFDETLLSSIADASGGAFYFIDTPDNAPATFLEELGELLNTVGQNLTLEFRLEPPAKCLALLNRYRAEETEHGLRVHVGDMFGGEQREIFAELWVPGMHELGPRRIGEVEINMDQVIEPIEHHRMVVPIEVNIVEPTQAPAASDPEVQTPATILRLAEVRGKMAEFLRARQLTEANELLEQTEAKLKKAGAIPPEVQAELDKFRQLLLRAEDVSSSLSSKYAHYEAYRSLRGRGDYRK